jgi:uncharacterized protein YcbX
MRRIRIIFSGCDIFLLAVHPRLIMAIDHSTSPDTSSPAMPILSELTLYPIKSCAGISLREAVLTSTGLMSEQIYDREWMVVDADGEALTQREFPKMALIVPRIKSDVLEVRAPGMLRLEIPLGLPHPDDERLLRVRVWEDEVAAYDCDEMIATWFSKAIGTDCRLVRFHPEAKRLASTTWTDGVEVPTFFSDGFPMLVIGTGSLADLNEKLVAQGRAALPMNRFRPNLVFADMCHRSKRISRNRIALATSC